MGRSGRLFLLLRPYALLFVANLVATFVASVMDGATFVLLIPFLRALFGQQALPAVGGSTIETLVAKLAGPLLATGAPQTALRRVVLVLLGALVVKNAAGYAAAMSSVAIEEGVVRDLRVRLFRHLQSLPLGFFQRTRGGQLLARIISDTDQVKTAVTAALASLVRNANLIVVYVAILFGLSWRLTLIALVLAPLLVLIIRPIVARVRRRSREQAEDRGELTSLVSEMVASVKLVRAYVAEAFEVERFQTLANRYRQRVLRAQGASTLTSPISEIFAGMVVVLIFSVGTTLALGTSASLRPEVFIAFVAVALRRPRIVCSRCSTCRPARAIRRARRQRASTTASSIGACRSRTTARHQCCRTWSSRCGAARWSRSSGRPVRARPRSWTCCRGSMSRRAVTS